jgi:hypothetical protein
MVNVLCKTKKGQDIPIGDGVIKQIERYCENSLTVLTTRWLEDIMASMREKSANSIGNTYAFVVNERLYDQLGRLLKDDLRFNANANGEYYWTNNGGSKMVGSSLWLPREYSCIHGRQNLV